MYLSPTLRAGLSPLALAVALLAQAPAARAQDAVPATAGAEAAIPGSIQAPALAPTQPAPAPERPALAGAPAPGAPPAQAAVPAASASVPSTSAQTVPTAEAQPGPKKSRELPPLVYARVSEDPVPTVTPATFLDTLRAAERYQAYAEAGGWQSLPANFAPKEGERHPAVPALRHHLTLTDDLPADAPPSDRYDSHLVAAVKRFQARHGLPDNGFFGRLTLAALNVPATVRQRQLAASAARLMGSNFAFGERYVVVNIPSATVEAVERGQVSRHYVAVVGSPDKPTPTIETRITDVNFNPTWTLPVSVVKNEIIPKMRKEPGWLAKNRIRILGPGGTEVDPTSIDWKTERAVNYTMRQDSGLDNSLGQVRIDMPNRHAVYMHDTPSKSLFARAVRFHSHGCVRVGQVKEFVSWLLEGTPGPGGPGTTWGPIEVETGIASGDRRDIKPAKAIPVAFVYLTGYATPDGRAHFRDDIYGLDSPAPVAAAPEAATTGSLGARQSAAAAHSQAAPLVAPPVQLLAPVAGPSPRPSAKAVSSSATQPGTTAAIRAPAAVGRATGRKPILPAAPSVRPEAVPTPPGLVGTRP